METKVTLRTHEAELEAMVDRAGLSAVLMQLAAICAAKADQYSASYQGLALERAWARAGGRIATCAASDAVSKASP